MHAACVTDADCNDLNACTTDKCLIIIGGGTTCQHTPPVFASGCANGCNGAATCSGSTCVPSGTLAAAGTTCSDGLTCTTADVCDGHGACVGVPIGNDNNSCTTDSCTESGGVVHAALPDGAACTPTGAVCTDPSIDKCSTGLCVEYSDSTTCSLHLCDSRGDPSADGVPVDSSACCVHDVDLTIATTAQEATRYLYTCANPLQVVTDASVFADPARVSAVHGFVRHTTGLRVPGVRVTVVGHPELGYTLTREDGKYDLAVTGGGTLVLAFDYPQAPGAYIPMYRSVELAPNRQVVVPDVILSEHTAALKTLSPGLMTSAWVGAADAGQGARTVQVYTPSTTIVKRYHADGTPDTAPPTQGLAVDELTVGTAGPTLMPATLPKTSAYTYAVDITLDSARTIPGEQVRFVDSVGNPAPLSYYLNNFLGSHLNPGDLVPVGWYDGQSGAWVPSENGVVIKIVSPTAHTISVRSDGTAATPTDLSTLQSNIGLTSAEIVALTSAHAAGDTVWRVRIPHLSVWDFNFGGEVPSDAAVPPTGVSTLPDVPQEPTCTGGSIIGCEARTLKESFDVTGAPFSLVYQSDRARGYLANNDVVLTLAGASVPTSLARVEASLSVGGSRQDITPLTRAQVIATPKQTLTWNGTASDGSSVEGVQTASIDIDYVYTGNYIKPLPPTSTAGMPGEPVFGSTVCTATGGSTTSCDMGIARVGAETHLTRHIETSIGTYHAQSQGLGGLTLSTHHRYDVASRTLWLGDGRRLRAGTLPLTTFGITDSTLVDAQLGVSGGGATFAASAPDGSMHTMLAAASSVLAKVNSDGTLEHEAGVGNIGSLLSTGDGGDAAVATFAVVRGLAFGPDGSAYVAEQDDSSPFAARVRRISTAAGGARVIDTFVGGPVQIANVDGKARYATPFAHVHALAVAPDGTVYVSARLGGGSSVDGIYAFPSNGEVDPNSGTPRLVAALDANALAVGPDGAVYAAVTDQVIRIDLTNGNKQTAYVGSGGAEPSPSPQLATSLKLSQYGSDLGALIGGLAFLSTGELMVQQVGSIFDAGRLIRVSADQDDAVRTAAVIAGNELVGQPIVRNLSSGQPALTESLGGTLSIAVDGGDNILIPEVAPGDPGGVRRVGSAVPGFGSDDVTIADPDTGALYAFDAHDHPGRHLRTLDPLLKSATAQTSHCGAATLAAGSPVVLREFCYDASGRVTAVHEESRDTSGAAVSRTTTLDYSVTTKVTITAPDGQQTTIGLNGTQQATSVTDPMFKSDLLTFLDGQRDLLTKWTDRNGHAHSFDYNTADGTLAHDKSPAISPSTTPVTFKTLTRTMHPAGDGWSVDVVEPNPTVAAPTQTMTTTHDVTFASNGAEIQTTKYPSVSRLLSRTTQTDGSTSTQVPDGTQIFTTTAPDPVYGTQAPFVNETDVFMTQVPIGGTGTVTIHQWFSSRNVAPTPAAWTTLTTTSTTPLGHQSTTVFDNTSNTWITTSAEGRTMVTTVDATGRPTRRSTPGIANDLITTYAGGKIATAGQGTGAGARTVSYAYYATGAPDYGYVHTRTDSLSRTTTFTPDSLGRPTSVSRADGGVIGSAFDPVGNVTSVTPSLEPMTSFVSNELDVPKSSTAPAVTGVTSTETDYAMDDDRRIWKVTRPDTKTASIVFDSGGRPGSVTLDRTDSGADSMSASYSSVTGQLTSLSGPTDAGGTSQGLAFTYSSSLPASVKWTGPVGGTTGTTVDFEYDADLQLQRDRAGGMIIQYLRDMDGVITSTESASNAPQMIVSPLLSGTQKTVLLGGTTLGTLTDAYTYDAFGGLESYALCTGSVSSCTPASALYSIVVDPITSTPATSGRDAVGRIHIKTETIGGVGTTWTYGYDSADRLSSAQKGTATAATYTYDGGAHGNGNRTGDTTGATSMSYDAQDRLTSRTSGGVTVNYTYDDAGERKTKNGTNAASYVYNAAGTLRSVTMGATKYLYTIDGLGRRIARSHQPAAGGTITVDEEYVYLDQTRIGAVLDGTGALLWRFVYATGRHTPDYAVDASGTLFRLVTDQLGSVRLVVNATSGAIVQRTDYDAWGVATDVTLPTHVIPLGFAGGLYDRTTKLVHFGAREYDPEVGAWTSKDPVGFGGGLNVYSYAGDDPVNFADPSGFAPGTFYGTESAALENAGYDIHEASMASHAEEATIIYYVDGHGYTYLPPYSPGEQGGALGPLYDQLPASTPIAHPLHNHPSPQSKGFSKPGDNALDNGGDTGNHFLVVANARCHGEQGIVRQYLQLANGTLGIYEHQAFNGGWVGSGETYIPSFWNFKP